MSAPLAVAVVLSTLATGTVQGVEPSDSANRLDHPIADLAVLEPSGPDGAPRLLVIDAIPPAPGAVRLRILERDRSWNEASSLDIDLATDAAGSAETPWLIGLGPTAFALLSRSTEDDVTQVVAVRTDGGAGGRDLEATARIGVTGLVDDAGAADVDFDGTSELVLGRTAGSVEDREGCQGSRLLVVDGASLVTRAEIDMTGQRLLGGVIGRWDAVPGDDLLAYAQETCPFDRSTGPIARLAAVRLADGEAIDTGAVVTASDDGGRLGAPLRFAATGGNHAALIRGDEGLSVVEPARGWATTVVAGPDTFPLSAGPAGAAVDGQPRTWLAWVDFERDAIAATAAVDRSPDGAIAIGPSDDLPVDGVAQERTRWLAAETEAALIDIRPATTWTGPIRGGSCLDLFLPGARLACDDEAVRPGAAWIGTRPLTVLGEGNQRRLLVAGGVAADPLTGLPESPAPWAAAPAGWWRHGPTAPFVLAELRAGDTVYYNDFPEPRSSVERATQPDASTVMPAFTGTRLLVHASASAVDAVDVGDVAAERVLLDPAGPTDLRTIVRIPVPPGLDSGRDGAAIGVPLAGATFDDGARADRWLVRAVPVNDWGEVGTVAAGFVQRDGTGPTLTFGVPFTTPVWPLPARLTGTAEPGAVVVVEGVGTVELARRGEFEFQTTLAPWPQTLRIVATDESGNQTVREVSIVGGVDYRQFPWTIILAVVILAVVAASGFLGVRRRPFAGTTGPASSGAVGGAARSVGWLTLDDGLTAEIEDLPPGAGLPPR